MKINGGFLSHRGTLNSSIQHGLFHYKPSIFGYPHDYGNPKMDDDWGKIDDHWGYTLVQETDKFGLL